MDEPTPAYVWFAVAGRAITDELLEWPPDLFALTNVILKRSGAFRYALSLGGWPPRRYPDWANAVEEAALRWSVWAEDRAGAIPDMVAEESPPFGRAPTRH